MIEKMVLNLVSQMESKRMIDKAVSDQYEYALVTLIEHTITVGTMLLIGLIFNQFIPTICFLVFFLSLRKRTGGYHADKFWQCYLVTVIIYISIIQAATVLSETPIAVYVMLSLAVLVIGVIGTVNHPIQQEARKYSNMFVEPSNHDLSLYSKSYINPNVAPVIPSMFVGRTVDLVANKKVDGLINAYGFNCCLGKITTACINELRKEHENLPMLNFIDDGLEQTNIRTRLESFMEQVKVHI